MASSKYTAITKWGESAEKQSELERKAQAEYESTKALARKRENEIKRGMKTEMFRIDPSKIGVAPEVSNALGMVTKKPIKVK